MIKKTFFLLALIIAPAAYGMDQTDIAQLRTKVVAAARILALIRANILAAAPIPDPGNPQLNADAQAHDLLLRRRLEHDIRKLEVCKNNLNAAIEAAEPGLSAEQMKVESQRRIQQEKDAAFKNEIQRRFDAEEDPIKKEKIGRYLNFL